MRDVSIKTKLLLLVILSIFVVSLVLIISSILSINYISESNINKYEKESYKSKEIELKNHVETAVNIIKSIAQNPTFDSLEEKQKVAKEVVKNMLYGEDGYFWINDSNHVLVMHPIKPENVGKNMYESKDPNGVMIYQEIVKAANANEKGALVKYGWSKPGLDGVQPKFSYVIRYADWDWIIGTGAYVDDVQREVDAMKNETQSEINDIVIKTLILCLSISFVISFLFIFISNKVIITPILKFQDGLLEFFKFINKEVKEAKPIEVNANDEIGKMSLVVNENILKTQKLLQQDANLIENVKEIVQSVNKGFLDKRVTQDSESESLNELKNLINDMLKNLQSLIGTNINDLSRVLESYANYDFTKQLDSTTCGKIGNEIMELNAMITKC